MALKIKLHMAESIDVATSSNGFSEETLISGYIGELPSTH
jgi:hypothetical protein